MKRGHHSSCTWYSVCRRDGIGATQVIRQMLLNLVSPCERGATLPIFYRRGNKCSERSSSCPGSPAREWWILNLQLSGCRASVLSSFRKTRIRIALWFAVVCKLSHHTSLHVGETKPEWVCVLLIYWGSFPPVSFHSQ